MIKRFFSTPAHVATGLRLARASEWWAYKFAPLLATAYATAVLARVPLWPLLPQVLLLLLASTVGATFVSLLNDWTDRADDAAAGKTNRLAHKSGRFVAGALAGCVAAGLGFGWYFWRASHLGSLLYGGAWLAYALYSLPPFRLKARGLAGVLADAAGAHLFPHLFTAVLLSAWAGRPASGSWLLAVGGWALGAGVRNILWHQLGDAAADLKAGVRTFVVKQGPARAKMVAAGLALPLELLGLAALLWQLAAGLTLLPLLALGGYAALAWFRGRVWQQPLVVAAPRPQGRILLNDYYEVWYPLAMLLAQARQYPADGLVLGLHALLFGTHIGHNLRDGAAALHILGRKLLRFRS